MRPAAGMLKHCLLSVSFFPLFLGETGKDRSSEPTCVQQAPVRAAEVKGSSQGPGIFRPFLAGKIWVEDPLDWSEHSGLLFQVGERGFSTVLSHGGKLRKGR